MTGSFVPFTFMDESRLEGVGSAPSRRARTSGPALPSDQPSVEVDPKYLVIQLFVRIVERDRALPVRVLRGRFLLEVLFFLHKPLPSSDQRRAEGRVATELDPDPAPVTDSP